MYLAATIIFLIGSAAGGLYGWLWCPTPMGIIMAVLLGGFMGSVAGGILFTWLYFTSGEDEKPCRADDSLPSLPSVPEPSDAVVGSPTPAQPVKSKNNP